MRIINRVTTSMGIIEEIKAYGTLDLFLRSFRLPQGYSLEIFRNLTHLTSMNTVDRHFDLTRTIGANKILRVNLGYRTLQMKSILSTHDGYNRPCSIEIRFHVSDAPLFSMQYLQESDPIFLAQREIERIFNLYTIQKRHDQIDSIQLRNLSLSSFTPLLHQRHGITVDEIYRIDLLQDPHLLQITQLQQGGQIKEVEINQQASLDALHLQLNTPTEDKRLSIELNHSSQRNAHERAENDARLENERRQADLDHQQSSRHAIQNTFIHGTIRSIDQDFQHGYRPDEIMLDRPEVQQLLGFRPTEASGASPTTGANFRINARRIVDAVNTDNPQHVAPPSQPVNFAAPDPTQPAGSRQTPDPTQPMHPHQVPDYAQPTMPLSSTSAPFNNQPTDNTAPGPTIPPISPFTQNLAGRSYVDPLLGITLRPLTNEERHNLATIQPAIQFCVQEVQPSHTNIQNQLYPGDYLISINDEIITDFKTYQRILAPAHNRTPLVVRVYRDDELIDLEHIYVTR